MNLKSGYPYFLFKSGLKAEEYTKLQSIKTTDVVIRGGSYSGSLAEYHLPQKGISSIVVDLRSIGLGNTCASTSLLQKYIERSLLQLKSTFALTSKLLSTKSPFWKDDILLWNTGDPYLYLRTIPDNSILKGIKDEDFYSPEKRDALLVSKTRSLVKEFKKLTPKKPFAPQFNLAGTFGSSKIGLPFIGTYKKLHNSFLALGFGGNGITFSLIAAEMTSADLAWK